MHRLRILVPVALLACNPPPKTAPPPAAPVQRTAAPPRHEPQCHFAMRRVSAPGKGAARPQIAVAGDAFAVAWEETTDHRSVHVQTFGDDAQPLGPSIELADLARAGAEPRVAAMPDPADGFAVFWSSEQGESSSVVMRRVDRGGKPKSDVVPIVTAPGARPLAAVPTESGFAVAWWNWTGTPHTVAVTFIDKEGRPQGRAVAVTKNPSADPDVDLWPAAVVGKKGLDAVAWEELVDGIDHVVVGDLSREGLQGRIDFGSGDTPELGRGVVVFERPADQGIYAAPLAGGAPVRIADGHIPAAAPRGNDSALCFVKDVSTDEEHNDELWCGRYADRFVDGTRVTAAPRGILAVQTAADRARIGAVWQTQEHDDTVVSFATLSCPGGAVAARR